MRGARGTVLTALSTEVDSKEHQEAFVQANDILCHSKLAVIKSLLLLMELLDDLKPEDNYFISISILKSVKLELDSPMGYIKLDLVNYNWTRISAPYQQLLSKMQALFLE